MPRNPFTKRRAKSLRLAIIASTVVCAAAVPGSLCVASSNAEPVDEFYTPPTQFDTTPGAVIRTAAMPVLLAPPGVDAEWPIAAQRVLYSSRTQSNDPVAVSGTFIDATRPWQGSGPRPTIVIAPGTVGQGDQCAPSLAFSTGLYIGGDPLTLSANQEALSAIAWNSLGARVFVTDYIGMGTPGVHTYANRVEEGHAVLDAARAANTLSGGDVTVPLGFWGYSQGGGAAASAAEMLSTYAPELNLKGTWAGAPTADLSAIVQQIDGNLIGGAIGFAINGFQARYPELSADIDAIVTPAGQALLGELEHECITDVIVRHPFMRTSDLTIDHRPLSDHVRELPEAARIFEQQRIGDLRPTSPVLITSGINDDTIPYSQARQLAVDWCSKGATVTFRTNELPPIASGTTFANHFGPELIDGFGTNSAISYLVDRFADKPISNCTFD